VFDSPLQARDVFPQTFRPIMGPIQPHLMGAEGGVVVRPGGETDHSPSSAEVKCVRSCTAPLVSVINPRDRLRHYSKNNSAFSGPTSMSSLSPLLGALARCHKVLGCGSYGTSNVHFSTGRNTLRGGLEKTADGHIQRDTREKGNPEELNKHRTDIGSVETKGET
jgi:hypothetical protein